MELWLILLIVYGGVFLGISARYFFATKKFVESCTTKEIETASIQSFVPSILADAAMWPWNLVWHGLRVFIRDLRM
jgi:hypothetical protein